LLHFGGLSIGNRIATGVVASFCALPMALADEGKNAKFVPPVGTAIELSADTSDVDRYLCGVYRRMPHKIDEAGDFSWKDAAAAIRSVRSVCDYAINGMHPDLRESLYALGHYVDEARINWSFLSAFRDDYRQSIATGFKASTCGSLHGGSCRTQGWGDGRAADLWISDQGGYPARDASPLLDLIDRIGASLGLSRPMPGADPPHVQVSGNWQKVGMRLREKRIRYEASLRSDAESFFNGDESKNRRGEFGASLE
jgi:hypothetical protein